MLRLFIILSLLLTSSVTWAQTKLKVTGLFSDMQYIEEAGDVIGNEIYISYSNSGYFAVIQCAEGSPSKPVVVSASIKGSQVILEPHNDDASDCPKSIFKGEISSRGLRGEFEGTDFHLFLKRKNSYWQ